MIDEIDKAIINELQRDGSIDMKSLRDRVNKNLGRRLSVSTIYHRNSRLLEDGVIRKSFIPDYDRVGKSTMAFIAVKFEGHDEEIFRKLSDIRGVMEVHAVGGQYDVFLKVRAGSIHEVADLVFKIRTEFDIVKATEIFIVLKSEKETPAIEL